METMRKAGWIWPVLPPFAVLVVGALVFQQFAKDRFRLDVSQVNPDRWLDGLESSSRFWVATTLLLLLAAAGAAVILAVSVLKERGRLREGSAIAIGIAALAAVLVETIPGCGADFACLGKDVFERTVGKNGVAALELVIPIGNAFAAFAAAFVAVAVASLEPEPVPDLPGKQDTERAMVLDEASHGLADRINLLKYLLFAASATLFAGALHMKAWRDWPLAFFTSQGGEAYKAYSQLATATVNFEAVHFVLILVAIFVPMAVRLRMAGGALAREATGKDPAARGKWIESHGIGLPMTEHAKRLFALLTPFLAAPAVAGLNTITDYLAGK